MLGDILSLVSIVRGNGRDIDSIVREAVELAGGLKAFVTSKSRVLIKPNLVSPEPSGSGVVTDCRVTEAVSKLVLECNPASVVIGEGSAYLYDYTTLSDAQRGLNTMDAFKASGTLDVAERLGIEVVDLNRDAAVDVTVPRPLVVDRFKIAKTVVESDVIINVPVMKSHSRTIISVSYKNLKGVLPLAEKKKTHRLGLEQAIVDLNRIVKSSFTVVDALTCRVGRDRLAKMNVIVAGRDGVAVDAVCTKIMGFDIKKIRTITLAAEQGLGVGDVNDIEIRGATIESVMRQFEDPRNARTTRYPGLVCIDDLACSSCEGELNSPLYYIREAGLVDLLDGLIIVMGKQTTPPKIGQKTLFVGECVREFKDMGPFVDGCPPRGWVLTEKMCEICGIDKTTIIETIETIHGKLSEIG